MKRTLENCGMIKKHGRPEQHDGRCAGIKKPNGDELFWTCEDCKLNDQYDDEAVFWMNEAKGC